MCKDIKQTGIFFQSHTLSCRTHIYRSTGLTHSNLTLTCETQAPNLQELSIALLHDTCQLIQAELLVHQLYIDCFSNKENLITRSVRQNDNTSKNLINWDTSYQCSGQATMFMLIDCKTSKIGQVIGRRVMIEAADEIR